MQFGLKLILIKLVLSYLCVESVFVWAGWGYKVILLLSEIVMCPWLIKFYYCTLQNLDNSCHITLSIQFNHKIDKGVLGVHFCQLGGKLLQ